MQVSEALTKHFEGFDPFEALPPENENLRLLWKLISQRIPQTFPKTLSKIMQMQNTKLPALALWGNPPVFNQENSLLFDFFRSKNVPIAGCQHGGHYGEGIDPWTSLSDYSQCDYYLSYGWDEAALLRTCPELKGKQHAQIIPTGSIRSEKHLATRNSPRINIDVLYPISFLNPGSAHSAYYAIDALKYLNAQEKIVDWMEYRKDLSCYVKPAQGLEHFTPAAYKFNQFKNVKNLNKISYADALIIYKPKIIIIDQYSTPVVESAHEDSQIFILLDDYLERCPVSVSIIEKKAFLFRDVDNLLQALEGYLEGKIAPRNDTSYAEHYFNGENASERQIKWAREILCK
jgi:hypothetical protein